MRFLSITVSSVLFIILIVVFILFKHPFNDECLVTAAILSNVRNNILRKTSVLQPFLVFVSLTNNFSTDKNAKSFFGI